MSKYTKRKNCCSLNDESRENVILNAHIHSCGEKTILLDSKRPQMGNRWAFIRLHTWLHEHAIPFASEQLAFVPTLDNINYTECKICILQRCFTLTILFTSSPSCSFMLHSIEIHNFCRDQYSSTHS